MKLLSECKTHNVEIKSLLQLRASLFNSNSLLSHGVGFNSPVVKQVFENCETLLKSKDDFQKTYVLSPILVQNIRDIVDTITGTDILL